MRKHFLARGSRTYRRFVLQKSLFLSAWWRLIWCQWPVRKNIFWLCSILWRQCGNPVQCRLLSICFTFRSQFSKVFNFAFHTNFLSLHITKIAHTRPWASMSIVHTLDPSHGPTWPFKKKLQFHFCCSAGVWSLESGRFNKENQIKKSSVEINEIAATVTEICLNVCQTQFQSHLNFLKSVDIYSRTSQNSACYRQTYFVRV